MKLLISSGSAYSRSRRPFGSLDLQSFVLSFRPLFSRSFVYLLFFVFFVAVVSRFLESVCQKQEWPFATLPPAGSRTRMPTVYRCIVSFILSGSIPSKQRFQRKSTTESVSAVFLISYFSLFSVFFRFYYVAYNTKVKQQIDGATDTKIPNKIFKEKRDTLCNR